MVQLVKSPFKEIGKNIAIMREKKGKEKGTLSWINEAFRLGQGFLVSLYFERILVYQHMLMEGDKKALPKMEAATMVAMKFVKQNRLKEWDSRVYRFLGRLYDYKNQYQKSIPAYKKAISLAKFDPEYIEEGVPRWLELEGFLSYSLLMSGKTKIAIDAAKKTYQKYDANKEALALKKKDYYTWVVWKSGIPIRTINALLSKNITFDKIEMTTWLADAEEIINLPKSAKVWGDFSLRKDEITTLKRKLNLAN
jgi:tetratricopeptide (TPR) repeat protein